MEYLYSLTTKLIDDKNYYFVKKIMTFPEFKGLANVLIGYGMHTSFEKACNISGVHDNACRKKLLFDLEQLNIVILPVRQTTLHMAQSQKPREKRSVQIADMINRWMAERGAEVLN
jgi:hypothetical protein